MNTTLSNNQKLLRAKKLFKKERTFLRLSKSSLKGPVGKVKSTQTSEEELLRIRKKIIGERRKQNLILMLITIVVTVVMGYVAIGLMKQHFNDLKSQQNLVFQKKEKKFLVLLEKGDDWFKEGKWHNSIFYYKKAKEIFPVNYDINYRLVRSYSFQCESEFKKCREAKTLLDELFLRFPDKESELLGIKKILVYEY